MSGYFIQCGYVCLAVWILKGTFVVNITETRIMRRLQVISTMLLLCVAVAGCSSNQAQAGDDGWQTYSNEFFSIEYPPDWHIWQEDVQEVPDSIPDDDRLFSRGIRLGLSRDLASSSYECVIVQKSFVGEFMFEELPDPENWRDMSIFSKQFDDSYIDIVEDYFQDSISFGSFPAAMVGYVVAPEEGDTIIHKQIIVIVDKKELYYLNNQFLPGDEEEERLGDSILATIRFKNE